MTSIITLPTGPSLEIGPLSLAWHGLFTALGILVATFLALQFGRERDLDRDRILTLVIAVSVAGVIGARAFYLVEHDPDAFLAPGRWLSSTGFSFYGAVIFAVPTALLLYRDELRLTYLDALASGFGLGMAVGRVGDILIGEHLGGASDLPWAFRYSNPDALAPSTDVAYQPGPLYESILGLIIFAVIWPRRARFQSPGSLVLAVLGIYAVGRFAIFFFRDDSDVLALGLSNAQITSIGIAVACLLVYAGLRHRRDPRR
ncbi:MAG: diacylglyceryl transferase [Alphaproteobacteria bacterium]|nr:MAG: diacylglyceryl transferase [Alphaproteobacteria bacterium]